MDIVAIATVSAASSIASGIAESVLPDKVVPNISVDLQNYGGKPFIICLYKDLPREELKLLQSYGLVLEYNEAFVNCKLQCDYLILDFRNQAHFMYYQIYVKGNENFYHLILYRHKYEKNNGIKFHNELTKLPPKQLNKTIYDKLLLQEVHFQPNSCVACLRSVFKRDNNTYNINYGSGGY
jgi:hypothetical protein